MRILIWSITIIVAVSLPSLALAQNFFGPIVPQCAPYCQFCHFVEMADNIIRFLISLFAVIGAILITYAGFLMATAAGSPGQVSKGKGILTNTIIGLIIMLVAWLAVDTIMKMLAGGQAYGMWQEIQCVRDPSENYGTGAVLVEETGMDELYNDPGSSVVPVGSGDLVLTETAAAHLQSSGISVKAGASLNGLQPHVLDRVIQLNNACGCNLVITEGTGGTHAQGTYSHSNGYKLDIRTRDNPALLDYVKKNSTFIKDTKYGPMYQSGNNVYLIEGDHLDVQFRP